MFSKFLLNVNARRLFFICLIFVVVVLVACSSIFLSSKKVHSQSANTVVVLDAGHGGIDGGVTGTKTGVKESEINLAIVKKLQALFKNAGFEVVLTRSNSGGLYGHTGVGHKKRDMQAREKIIKGASPTLFISIHQNKFSDSARRGSQVFYKAGSNEGYNLANCVQSQVNALNKGGRQYSALKGDYYLLNVSPFPAIIVECGFLSNAQDEALLISEEYQQALAQSIFYGAMQFLVE